MGYRRVLSIGLVGFALSTSSPAQAGAASGIFSVESFQTDTFIGAATAQITIATPPGAGGTGPQIALTYNSVTVDELGSRDQGQCSGLGWTLQVGGFVARDTKATTGTGDDTFKLVFGGAAHDLVLIDSVQKVYHTKTDMFWKVQYNSQSDYWTLITKDGTVHRFGFNADSKAKTLGQDYVTPITYRYMIDEAKTTSGVSTRWSYVKETATAPSTGRSYDRAIYPDTITWSDAGGSPLGSLRQARFLRAPRTDWTDTRATTQVAFFETSRVDAIEVSVGSSLVRKYTLAYDYSIDRDPGYTWGGGATGDLTLRSITVYGSDGVSQFPSATFNYTNARLTSSNNGLGGSASFAYQAVPTRPLYLAQVSGSDFGGSNTSGTALLGYVLNATGQGTVGVYSIFGNNEWYVATSGSTLLGAVLKAAQPGANMPLYNRCINAYFDPNFHRWICLDSGPNTTPSTVPPSTFLGYMYLQPGQRQRVISRTLSDGRGGGSTTTFSYTGLAFSTDGKEFRGYNIVRSTDSAGTYTDTWFHQNDALKGRPYQVETRNSAGALFTRVTNTWTASNPYPGVTFAALTRADAYACDGGATCRQTAQSFEYDTYGNLKRLYSWGDVAVAGDERDERTDWLVDAANWIHRPSHTTLHDAASVVVREKWLSYDGLPWGALGTRGLLTREESRLAGSVGSAGNPVSVHSYDAYGNRSGTTDPRGCTTSMTYESSQTHPASISTCVGHTTTLAYDPGWGVKTSETDANGQATTYLYDTFGRLTRIVGGQVRALLDSLTGDALVLGRTAGRIRSA